MKYCLYIKIYALKALASAILKKIYIAFIYKYCHYNLCQCYFEEDKSYLYSYLFALLQKLPKDIVPIVPISITTSILLKLRQLCTIPEQLRIGWPSRKCYKIIQWKQRVQKLRRVDVETTSKNPRGELIDISPILKVESTLNFPRRIDVIIPRGFTFQNRCNSEQLST